MASSSATDAEVEKLARYVGPTIRLLNVARAGVFDGDWCQKTAEGFAMLAAPIRGGALALVLFVSYDETYTFKHEVTTESDYNLVSPLLHRFSFSPAPEDAVGITFDLAADASMFIREARQMLRFAVVMAEHASRLPPGQLSPQGSGGRSSRMGRRVSLRSRADRSSESNDGAGGMWPGVICCCISPSGQNTTEQTTSMVGALSPRTDDHNVPPRLPFVSPSSTDSDARATGRSAVAPGPIPRKQTVTTNTGESLHRLKESQARQKTSVAKADSGPGPSAPRQTDMDQPPPASSTLPKLAISRGLSTSELSRLDAEAMESSNGGEVTSATKGPSPGLSIGALSTGDTVTLKHHVHESSSSRIANALERSRLLDDL